MNRTIMPVAVCGAVGQCLASPSEYASRLSTYGSKPAIDRVARHALEQLEAARAKDVAAHEANLPAIESNVALRAEVEAFMVGAGFPRKVSRRDANSRARFPKTITEDAGWLQDLQREVRVDDSFLAASSTYERMKARYQEFADSAALEAQRLARAAADEQDRARRERLANVELAEIILRYELPRDSDWADVLEALRPRHQRIDLGLAMLETRSDWSEGAYRVRDALGSFSIQTDEDKDIVVSVTGGLEDFSDGRVFRDMEWNYDRILTSVPDQRLVSDVLSAHAQVRR